MILRLGICLRHGSPALGAWRISSLPSLYHYSSLLVRCIDANHYGRSRGGHGEFREPPGCAVANLTRAGTAAGDSELKTAFIQEGAYRIQANSEPTRISGILLESEASTRGRRRPEKADRRRSQVTHLNSEIGARSPQALTLSNPSVERPVPVPPSSLLPSLRLSRPILWLFPPLIKTS